MVLLQLWLTKPAAEGGLGFDGTKVGLLYSVNSAATLIIMFFYGTLQDRLGTKRHLAILIGAIATLAGPFVVFVYGPLLRTNYMLGVIIGAVVLSAGFMAGPGLMEAIAERMSRLHKFEYGQARMWGSFGYAIVALIAGFVFVIGSWTFYNLFDQQMFPDLYTDLFESKATGERVYGVLNSAQVFLEAIVMGLIPILMRKVGVKKALLLGVTVMALRILGCAVFDDPIIVSAVKMLHAIEVPLFILPIFRHFTLHFNPLLSATLYMVGFQIASQIGTVILSTPMGALRDSIGYQPTFFVISGIVAVAGVYAFFVLKPDDKDVLGDPFVLDSKKSA